MAVTRVFKSGNSAAVRLPKELGVDVGTELEVVRSGEVIELRPVRRQIDVSGFAGSMPWLKPVEREDWEEREIDWECKRVGG